MKNNIVYHQNAAKLIPKLPKLGRTNYLYRMVPIGMLRSVVL